MHVQIMLCWNMICTSKGCGPMLPIEKYVSHISTLKKTPDCYIGWLKTGLPPWIFDISSAHLTGQIPPRIGRPIHLPKNPLVGPKHSRRESLRIRRNSL